MHRFELKEGSSSKFWQYEVRGSDLVVEYGRIGTAGQSSSKSFPSPAAAQAAADKLVKEKTGKGYARVAVSGGTSAPRTSVPEAQAAADGDGRPLPWISEAALAALGAKLAKKSKLSPRDLVNKEVGDGDVGTFCRRCDKTAATIAALVDRGLVPPKLISELASDCRDGWSWMRPEKLLEVVSAPDVDRRHLVPGLLRVGFEKPALIGKDRDATFAPAIAKVLPLVRRLLGLTTEELSDELASLLLGSVEVPCPYGIRSQVFGSYAERRAFVGTLGIAADRFDALVFSKGADGFAPNRAEPYLLRSELAALPDLLERAPDMIDSALVMRCLDERKDPPEDLIAMAQGWDVGPEDSSQKHLYRLREAVAVTAGARLAAAGRPIPKALDEMIWFLETGRPATSNPAYAQALAAWPRERVLARVRELLAPAPRAPDDELPLAVPARVAVGLGVYPDAGLTKQLLDGIDWMTLHDDAPYLGRLGKDWLPELLARGKGLQGGRQQWVAAVQTLIVTSAEQTGAPFDAELDVHFTGASYEELAPWERALALLPQARKDAHLLEINRKVRRLGRARIAMASEMSDDALDALIGVLFEKRNADPDDDFSRLGEPLLRCGPRTQPMIRRHFLATGGDPAAVALLENLPVTAAEVAALLTEAGVGAAPTVLEPAVASALDALFAELCAQKPDATIKLAAGMLQVAESGHATPRSLRRKVPKGNGSVHAHYADVPEGSPTAGLDALCLRFGKSKVASWEAAPPSLGGDVVGLVLGDESSFGDLEDEDRDALDEHIQGNIAYGDAVATYQKKLVTAYLGEVATDHRMYWGLDEAGAPSCLIARFL